MARDIGTSIGTQAAAIGVTTAALIQTGHIRGLEAMDRARQDRIDAAHAANAVAERQNHADLASLAKALAARLAASEAENRRLRTALAQRQAFIDRIRQAQ